MPPRQARAGSSLGQGHGEGGAQETMADLLPFNLKKVEIMSSPLILSYSGAKNKRQKPDFPYKIGIFKRLFRDRNIGELL